MRRHNYIQRINSSQRKIKIQSLDNSDNLSIVKMLCPVFLFALLTFIYESNNGLLGKDYGATCILNLLDSKDLSVANDGSDFLRLYI